MEIASGAYGRKRGMILWAAGLLVLAAGGLPTSSSPGPPPTGGLAFFRQGWIYHLPAVGRPPRKLVQGDFPALSPDGRRIAYCQTRRYNHSDPANAALVLLDLATGQPTVLLRPGEIISHPCWSPRGDRLGFLMLTEGCSEGVPFLFRSVEGRGCEGGKR